MGMMKYIVSLNIRGMRVIFALLTGLTLGLAELSITQAHGEATLTVSPATVAPGDKVTVKAAGVEAGETFTISLEGAQFKTTLGTVTASGDTFEQIFTIPTNAMPDSYQVRAVAGDGDTLITELTLAQGVEQEQAPAESTEPTDELMLLNRTKPAGTWITVSIAVLISAGLGAWLVTRRLASHPV
jgi:hypothetical protein